jgi:hypothetical protein
MFGLQASGIDVLRGMTVHSILVAQACNPSVCRMRFQRAILIA